MKRLLLTTALVGALLAPASAQVNVVPQTGVTSGYVPKVTYSAGFVGLAPASSGTDIICLAGSSSRTVKLTNITLSGSAGTLVSLPISLTRKATADTGGTAASTTANPANTITKADSQFPTATATPVSYTANPTIGDAGTIFASQSLTLGVTSAAGPAAPVVFDFLARNVNLLSPVVLRGAAQQICVNVNGVSVSSGLLNGSLTWTEETP